MSCDEFYHRHFHKKITHTHPHSKDSHHQHTHSGKTHEHNHPLSESVEDLEHFHEHTHEAAEHEHPHSFEHDPLHPFESEAEADLKEKKPLGGKEKHEMHNHKPLQTEEK